MQEQKQYFLCHKHVTWKQTVNPKTLDRLRTILANLFFYFEM